MPSASSPVRDALESYVAGRVKAERLVVAVAAAYYRGDGMRGSGDGLQSLIDIIDRASPGIVELGTIPGGAGFDVRLVERPFPKQYEAELRRAAEAVLAGSGVSGRANDVGAQHAAPLPNAARLPIALWRWVRALFSRPSA